MIIKILYIILLSYNNLKIVFIKILILFILFKYYLNIKINKSYNNNLTKIF